MRVAFADTSAVLAVSLGEANCWHLAVALFVAERPKDVTFLTLDVQQRERAKALGFRT
ncbi:MAG: hypothetical protein NW201_13350 [Gemmatimonadales bacterium]|nr:hypothetical protein [Gemmatimonadales bacterium]